VFFFFIKSTHNSETFEGIISKLYNIQGTNMIKAITIGNNTIQQNDISWSKRILGNEARTQMNVKIIIQDFVPKVRVFNNPSIKGFNSPNKPA